MAVRDEDDRAAKAKWLNVRDFVEWLSKKGAEDGKTLIELTQTVALMNLLEGRDNEEVDAVRLSTLHAAKGLEFPHVFLVGVEEEILPHRECLEGARLEEERRLMYVGITRAQRGLVISTCARRKRGGEITPCESSRFLDEIDPEQVRRTVPVAVPTPTAEVKEDGRAACRR
jgi:ATP-dependent DNA helicase Rep